MSSILSEGSKIEKGFVVEGDKPGTPKHPKPKGEYAVRSPIAYIVLMVTFQCGILGLEVRFLL